MSVSKQPLPAHIEAALPEFLTDIVEYLGLEETDVIATDDLTLAGYFSSGPEVAFVVYEYRTDDSPEFAAIQLNPQSSTFQDACVLSWGREESQTTEDALREFLELNPPD